MGPGRDSATRAATLLGRQLGGPFANRESALPVSCPSFSDGVHNAALPTERRRPEGAAARTARSPEAGGGSGMHRNRISGEVPVHFAEREGNSGGPYGVTSTST